MPESNSHGIELQQALTAQQALRSAANLPRELFPIPAFVGMISDEIEALRQTGKSDADIVAIIQANSSIEISADELARYYATPEERQAHDHS